MIYYVVMALAKPENLFQVEGLAFPIEFRHRDGDPIGYMPVFDSWDAAKAVYPDKEIMPVSAVEPEKESDVAS